MSAPDNMPTMADIAAAYAVRLGWFVFPLSPRSKEPLPGSRGLNDASNDEATVRAMFAAAPVDANIGLALEPSGLMAFDIDEYHGDHHKLAGLFQRLGPLPESLGHLSGSGQGRHLIYRRPPFPIRGAIDGVVLRGKNYLVLAPSIHPQTSREYTWVPGYGPGEIAPAELPPAWLEVVKKTAKVGAVSIHDDEPEWLAEHTQDERIADMRAHLERELGEVHPSFATPDTDPRRVRPSMMFTVACTAVREYAVREPEAVLDALREIYNARCEPPYSEDKLARAVYSAYERGEKAWGHRYDPAVDSERASEMLGPDPVTDEHVDEVAAQTAQATVARLTGPAQAASLAARDPAQAAELLATPVPLKEVWATLEAARDKLKRSTDATKKLAGNLLSCVRKSEIISDLREFVSAANTVARCVPDATTADQIRNVLLPCATGPVLELLPEIVARAMAYADTQPPLVAASRSTETNATLESLLTPDQALAEMNARFAWIESMGCVVDTSGDSLEYRKLEGFKTTYSNRKVLDGEEPAQLGTWWLTHPGRRSFHKIGLWAPPKDPPPGVLNLWRGFAVEPVPGNWSMMRAHIYEIIAAGVRDLDEYIVKWIAWTLQNPGERAGAAVVLRGGEGVGKGMLGNALARIFGPHAVHVTDPGHFVGSRFNKHMAECSFFFADECYWAGDRSHEGKIKGLITEPTIMIEPKGIDTYQVQNQLHILISSNNDWVVPAGTDARRYVISDVSAERQGQTAKGQYFDLLEQEINGGGLAAMLHDLLAFDLQGWHPRQIVDSAALRDQKERSLSPEGEWTLAICREAELPRMSRIMTSGGASTWVSFDEIRMHAQQTVSRVKLTDKVITSVLNKLGAATRREHQVRGRLFPDLATMRAAWCNTYFDYDFDDTAAWH